MARYQNAILPINDMVLTCGYKHPEYTRWFQRTYRSAGVIHYGLDCVERTRRDSRMVAPFDMEIVYAGLDYLMGYTIIARSIQKVDVHNGKYRGQRHISIRIAHMSRVLVKKGDKVSRGKFIGNYGGTGKYGGAAHAHIELDADVNYPNYSPSFRGNSTLWKGGSDTTINPMDVFKISAKQKLSYERRNASFLGEDDIYTLSIKRKLTKATYIPV